MYERGIVTSNINGQLKIKIIDNDISFCEKCSIKGLCNQEGKERFIILKSKKNFQEGAKVLVKKSEGFGILVAFLIFLMPIFVFIISNYFLTKFLPSLVAYLLSFLGVVFYYIFISIFQGKISSKVEIVLDNQMVNN